MNVLEKCSNCGKEVPQYKLKRGWNNGMFCCKVCEIDTHKQLFWSMPGHRSGEKLPDYILEIISNHWDIEE